MKDVRMTDFYYMTHNDDIRKAETNSSFNIFIYLSCSFSESSFVFNLLLEYVYML